MSMAPPPGGIAQNATTRTGQMRKNYWNVQAGICALTAMMPLYCIKVIFTAAVMKPIVLFAITPMEATTIQFYGREYVTSATIILPKNTRYYMALLVWAIAQTVICLTEPELINYWNAQVRVYAYTVMIGYRCLKTRIIEISLIPAAPIATTPTGEKTGICLINIGTIEFETQITYIWLAFADQLYLFFADQRIYTRGMAVYCTGWRGVPERIISWQIHFNEGFWRISEKRLFLGRS
jgi:hypothetical protein